MDLDGVIGPPTYSLSNIYIYIYINNIYASNPGFGGPRWQTVVPHGGALVHFQSKFSIDFWHAFFE